MHNYKYLSVGSLIKIVISIRIVVIEYFLPLLLLILRILEKKQISRYLMTAVFISFIAFSAISYGIQSFFGVRQSHAPELNLNLASIQIQDEFNTLIFAMESKGIPISEELQISIKDSLQQTGRSGDLTDLSEIWAQQYKNIIRDDTKLQSALMDSISPENLYDDEAIKNKLDKKIDDTAAAEHQSAIDFFAVDHIHFLMARAVIIKLLGSKYDQFDVDLKTDGVYQYFEDYGSLDLNKEVLRTSLNTLLKNSPSSLNDKARQIIKAQEKEDKRIIIVPKHVKCSNRDVDRELRSEDINALAKKLNPIGFEGQQNFSTFLKQHYKDVTQQSGVSKWRKVKDKVLKVSSNQLDLQAALKQTVGSVSIEHYFGSSALQNEAAQADKVKLDAAALSVDDYSSHSNSETVKLLDLSSN